MQTTDGLAEENRQLSLSLRLFGRSEIKELRHLLKNDEIVQHCAYGRYRGGSGILAATNNRILLVDKRLFYLNLEEVNYHQVQNVLFLSQSLSGTLYLSAGFRKLTFRSISNARLIEIKNFISEKVDEIQEAREVSNTFKSTMRSYFNPELQLSLHAATAMKRQYPTRFYVST